MKAQPGHDPSCPFCNLDRVRIAESSTMFAFKDDHPVSPGHTLVVSRRHVMSYFDYTPEEKVDSWSMIEQVRSLLTELHAPDGFNVGFNAGIAAGQTVPHAHLHVIPRYVGDVDDPRGGIRGAIPSKQNYVEVAAHIDIIRTTKDHPTSEYLAIWQEQAERERKRNPGDRAQIDLDTWIAILTELRARRATDKTTSSSTRSAT